MLPSHPISTLRGLLNSSAASGLALMASAFVALVMANSALGDAYFSVLKFHISGLSVLDWINDALMALFFLLVGLEIKRELAHGQLATWPRRILPGIGAVGGMLVPALIYVAINLNSPATLRGWAIPSATDIAFSLGVLALLSSRIPVSLKIFLTALAILDDLGAVIIIAVFYTSDLSPRMLALAAATVCLLAAMNRFGVTRLALYLPVGALLWLFVFKSGIHATIAGVLFALTIPLEDAADADNSPLERLEHALQPWVAFLVLPVFGFANAGVSFAGFQITKLAHPVTLGCALGLFAGKQFGIFTSVWLAVRYKLASRPAGATWPQIYGLAMLCGIGFTMSLFIGLLAFANAPEAEDATKIGILIGSLLSASLGWAVLRFAPPPVESRSSGVL